MLLQLHHALIRPKSGRRSIIHPRNHWSEIRDLRHAGIVHVRPPLKYQSSVRRWCYTSQRGEPSTNYSVLTPKLVSSSKLPQSILSMKRAVNISTTGCKELLPFNVKTKGVSSKTHLSCFGNTEFKAAKLTVCSEKKNLKEVKFKYSKSKTPFQSEQKAKHSRYKPKQIKFLDNYRSCSNKGSVSFERKFKPRNQRKQGWMDLMPSKPPRNHSVKSPYLVCPCVPHSKTYVGKPKVRSLLRLEQTPTFQIPPRISLKGSNALCEKSALHVPLGTRSDGQRSAKKTRYGREFCQTTCGKSHAAQCKVWKKQPWNNRGPQKRSLCPVVSLNPKLEIDGNSRVKARIESTPISRNSYLKTNNRVRKLEPTLFYDGEKTHPEQIKKQETTKLIRLCSKHSSCHHCDAECHSLSDHRSGNFKKAYGAQRYLERVEAKLQKLPLTTHGPGRVLAERLACDKRLMSSKAKWNCPHDARPREVFKNKCEPVGITECRMHVPMDYGVHCDTSVNENKVLIMEPKKQKNLGTLNCISPVFYMSLEPAMSSEAYVPQDSLSSQVQQTLQVKGKLVERVMSRFRGPGERNVELCELVHSLLPGVQVTG